MLMGERGAPSGVMGRLCAMAASSRKDDPRLEVRMMTVLAKLTMRPLESVTRPSSRIWVGAGGGGCQLAAALCERQHGASWQAKEQAGGSAGAAAKAGRRYSTKLHRTPPL